MSFDGFVYVVSRNLFEIAFVFLFSFFLNTGMEESNEVRPLVPVTEEEPLGHIALEKERAAVERRPPRNGYKDVPLYWVPSIGDASIQAAWKLW